MFLQPHISFEVWENCWFTCTCISFCQRTRGRKPRLYSCFRGIRWKLGNRSVLQMLADSVCCRVLLCAPSIVLLAFCNITVIYMIIYQLHVDGLYCIPKSARGCCCLKMKRQIIITGIITSQIVNKELDLCVRRFSGY